uniref:Histone domain-containing protein n=1 Tax=Panagrellus redivivus TaxID=6233 RepID=A0A7E4VKH7_PANRE
MASRWRKRQKRLIAMTAAPGQTRQAVIDPFSRPVINRESSMIVVTRRLQPQLPSSQRRRLHVEPSALSYALRFVIKAARLSRRQGCREGP